jgi:hypothetical protein
MWVLFFFRKLARLTDINGIAENLNEALRYLDRGGGH